MGGELQGEPGIDDVPWSARVSLVSPIGPSAMHFMIVASKSNADPMLSARICHGKAIKTTD
jgi:hypothetical protein